MNAWGAAFGNAWGDSWGAGAPVGDTRDLAARKRKVRIRPPERARLREDIIREQRMIAEYVESLEKNRNALPQAPRKGTAQTVAGTTPATAPRLTDAMARAASAEQLMAVIRLASAAELDRQKAVEEEHRRQRRTLLLLLALD